MILAGIGYLSAIIAGGLTGWFSWDLLDLAENWCHFLAWIQLRTENPEK